VIALAAGRVAFAGTPEELFADGDVLRACGLAVGGAGRLADRLRALGFPIPNSAVDPESVVDALWA
jgi:hypothetical protein